MLTLPRGAADDPEPAEAPPAAAEEEEEEAGRWWSNPAGDARAALHSGVGKFLPAAAAPRAAAAAAAAAEDAPAPKRAKPTAGGFGDFSGW